MSYLKFIFWEKYVWPSKVVRCTTHNAGNSENERKMVAVKYLKADASPEMEEYFRKEVEILSNFQHKNVIPLLGVNLDNGVHKCLILGMKVTETATGGGL